MAKGVHRGELSRERLISVKKRGGNVEAMREVNETGNNYTNFPVPAAAGRGNGLANGHGNEAESRSQ